MEAAPNGKEPAKEAQTLEQEATAESDPQKALEIRKNACNKWEEAYDTEKKPDYLLSVGLCRAKTQELDDAEKAFRLFLVKAPADHKGRSAAEQSLERIVAERQVSQENTPQALTVTEPIPIQDTSKQWKRKLFLAGGALTGLGLIGGAIVVGVACSQDEFSRGTITAAEQ